MIEAGAVEAGVLPAVAMGQHDVVDEGAVGEIGEPGGVQGGVVGERRVDADPHELVVGDGLALRRARWIDVAHVHGASVARPDSVVVGALFVGELVVSDGDLVGRGRGRHRRSAVFEAVLRHVEGGDEAKDLAAVLRRDHLAGAEGAAVADAVDAQVEGFVRVSGAKEVSVQ